MTLNDFKQAMAAEGYINSEMLTNKVKEIVNKIPPADRSNYPVDDVEAAAAYYEIYLGQINGVGGDAILQQQENISHTTVQQVIEGKKIIPKAELSEEEVKAAKDAFKATLSDRKKIGESVKITTIFVNNPPVANMIGEGPHMGLIRKPKDFDHQVATNETIEGYKRIAEAISSGKEVEGQGSTSVTTAGVEITYNDPHKGDAEVSQRYSTRSLVGFILSNTFMTISNGHPGYPVGAKLKQITAKESGKNGGAKSYQTISMPQFVGLNSFLKSYYGAEGSEPLPETNQLKVVEINRIVNGKYKSKGRLRVKDSKIYSYKYIDRADGEAKTRTVTATIAYDKIPITERKEEFEADFPTRSTNTTPSLTPEQAQELFRDYVAAATKNNETRDTISSFGMGDLIDSFREKVTEVISSDMIQEEDIE